MLREEETVPSKLEVALLYPHNNCTGSSFSPSVSRSEVMMTSSLKRRFHSPTSYLDGASSDQEAMGEEDENNSIEKRARRLSADQVKALEKAFEVENKLEPERKANLASQLGLQERQIAVWFQNRRARCKTKQMEKDFQALKKKMEALKADRDNLIKEKEQLEAEVLRLKREVKEKETVMEEERPATAEKAGLRLLRECENASTLMTSFNLPHASSKKEEASLCNNGSAIGEESTSESGLDCVEESSPKQSINSNLEEVAPLVADNAAVLIQGETVGFLQDMFPDAYDPKLLYELKGCLMSRAESSEFLTKEVAENDSGFVPFDWWEST